MNRYLNLAMYLGLLGFLSACSRTTEVALEPTLTPTQIPATPTPYPLGPSSVMYDNPSKWERIWDHDVDTFGEPSRIIEGLEGDLWFLYDHGLIHYINEVESESFLFDEMITCEECEVECNNTITISKDGDIWVGCEDGILILQENGESQFVPGQEIFPDNSNHESNILLTDRSGRIWVSGGDYLCSTDSIAWDCGDINEIFQSDQIYRITSAAIGEGDQIWFSNGGRTLILFDDGAFITEDLQEEFGVEFSIHIERMVFDSETGDLWMTLATTPPNTPEGGYDYRLAIARRGGDGEWLGYERDLFQIEDRSFTWRLLTNVATAPDGTVWASTLWGHGLVYFDGDAWYTWQGYALPFRRDLSPPESIVWDIIITSDGDMIVGGLPGIYRYHGMGD